MAAINISIGANFLISSPCFCLFYFLYLPPTASITSHQPQVPNYFAITLHDEFTISMPFYKLSLYRFTGLLVVKGEDDGRKIEFNLN